MTAVQAPAPARPKPPPATLRAARGLVFFRLKARPRGPVPLDYYEPVLARLRVEEAAPPYGAVFWRVTGGPWLPLGGRWLETGTGQKFWEWTA